MELFILNRLSGFLENNDVYTYNMISFRAELLTQNTMKLIKHHIVDGYSGDVKALLSLDLGKAFDNVLHTFLVKTISFLGLGSSQLFSNGQEGKLQIGDCRSKDVPLG